MSSKRFTIVLGILSVFILGYIAFKDAVGVKQNLQKQEKTIQHLDSQKTILDDKLEEKEQIKEKKQEEVNNLEKENQTLEEERNKLKQELQTNLSDQAINGAKA